MADNFTALCVCAHPKPQLYLDILTMYSLFTCTQVVVGVLIKGNVLVSVVFLCTFCIAGTIHSILIEEVSFHCIIILLAPEFSIEGGHAMN